MDTNCPGGVPAEQTCLEPKTDGMRPCINACISFFTPFGDGFSIISNCFALNLGLCIHPLRDSFIVTQSRRRHKKPTPIARSLAAGLAQASPLACKGQAFQPINNGHNNQFIYFGLWSLETFQEDGHVPSASRRGHLLGKHRSGVSQFREEGKHF